MQREPAGNWRAIAGRATDAMHLARGKVSTDTLPGYLFSGLSEGQKCPSAERVSLNFDIGSGRLLFALDKEVA